MRGSGRLGRWRTYAYVANTGDGPTGGSTATLTDTLPAGLPPISLSGTGWTCRLTPLSCTRSDVLAPGASYPPLTLTVQIANSVPKQVTNTATIAGGGTTATSTTTNDKPKPQPKPPHNGKPGHDRPGHGNRPGPRQT
ncbi:hypothetical protein V1460_16580 [Streptomyces sp. SCSIO 30461]|uniref:hypothetical protein n=1 Tax=Streptomyces sp. SCSIO 30461 TaxID=3118085 RepID=UPI0030D29738